MFEALRMFYSGGHTIFENAFNKNDIISARPGEHQFG